MLANLNFIEILLVGAAVYFGITAKNGNAPFSQTTAVIIMTAILLLIGLFGGDGDSPFGSVFGITIAGGNWTFLLICGAILYSIYSFAKKGKDTMYLWFGLAATFLLSGLMQSGIGTGTF